MSGRTEADEDGSGKTKSGFGWGKALVAIVLLAGICAIILRLLVDVSVVNKARTMKTAAILNVVGQGLEEYRIDHGDYPRPKFSDETMMIDGKAVKTGPARALYQALSSDGSDAIEGGDQASDGATGDSATFYWADIVNPLIDGRVRKGVPVAQTPNGLMLVDAWGHPFQYEMFDPERSDEFEQNTRNMTFDLSSYGQDESLGSNPEYETEWITNW
ncbi:MAG: hypothetical protein KDN22_24955 [Verrucomicrobiae bacterium]|nr:hypothetical protein [Verrucomicrobiae bacterium]